jgi:O-acetyl-ADP-ribose deacetylase (regulator of RNase III)
MLKIKQGNLFDHIAEYDIVAHCISRDVKMGAGIALTFRNKYDQPTVTKSTIAIQQVDNIKICHLLTKNLYWHKPTYESLKQSLIELNDYMLMNNLNTLAMPKIGCGLDRLRWNSVQNIILEVIDSTIEIIYEL